MTDKLLEFFEEIKEFTFWKRQWIKKIVYNNNGILKGIYERKFRKFEVKEICKDDKNNVINIKEYRYNEEGLLNKIVVKDNDGTLQYINEVIYDEGNIIKQIDTTTIEGKVRFKRILKFNIKNLADEEVMINNNKISLEDLSSNWYINLDKNLIQLIYSKDNENLYKFSYAIRDAMIFDFSATNCNINLKIGELFNFLDFDNIDIEYDKNNMFNKVRYIKNGQTLINLEYLFE